MGYFATATLRGEGIEGIEALAQLAKVEDRLSRDVIQEYVPLIVELRKNFPEINNPMGIASQGDRRVGVLDYGMERQGFIWSPGFQSYIRLDQKPAPIPATTPAQRI